MYNYETIFINIIKNTSIEYIYEIFLVFCKNIEMWRYLFYVIDVTR